MTTSLPEFKLQLLQLVGYDDPVNVRLLQAKKLLEWCFKDCEVPTNKELQSINFKLNQLITMNQEVKDLLGRINAATTNVASDIKSIVGRLNEGMSKEEVAELKTELSNTATKLEEVASAYEAPESTEPADTQPGSTEEGELEEEES